MKKAKSPSLNKLGSNCLLLAITCLTLTACIDGEPSEEDIFEVVNEGWNDRARTLISVDKIACAVAVNKAGYICDYDIHLSTRYKDKYGRNPVEIQKEVWARREERFVKKDSKWIKISF